MVIKDLQNIVFEYVIHKASYIDYQVYKNTKNESYYGVYVSIEQGADDFEYRPLFYACRGGHKKIVELMIENGAYYWNEGLEGACKGGHQKLVEFMIKKGADHCYACNNKKHNFN
jgi:ankyrin repeat protein